MQLEPNASPAQIFDDYLYFSSYSGAWLQHADAFAARMTEQLALGPHSHVVEVASNDGYLLRSFQQRGIDVLGVDPAANVAVVAQANGIPTEAALFGTETARRLAHKAPADLICANNVLAHVPDLNDFVAGLAILLKPCGTLTIEFPHLLRLIQDCQFDTIYHEHFSYFSLLVVQTILARSGLRVFDVDHLPTHGGSLRVYACHDGVAWQCHSRVRDVLDEEHAAGIGELTGYDGFHDRVIDAKRQVLSFLIEARRAGKAVAGYGAPAKGNTLLNYCGVGPELLQFTVDRSPHKQGRYLPGSHIPVFPPERLSEARPDYVFVLPWNQRDEIVGQLGCVRDWGGKCVVPIPRLQVF